MTENKRFTTLRMKNLIANEMGNYIQDNGTTILKLGFFEDCNDVCEVLNELSEENRQLREEIKDFQDLLSKGDNVCYERVLGLIDEKINNVQNDLYELRELKRSEEDLNPQAIADVELICDVSIVVLKKLKEELSENE